MQEEQKDPKSGTVSSNPIGWPNVIGNAHDQDDQSQKSEGMIGSVRKRQANAATAKQLTQQLEQTTFYNI